MSQTGFGVLGISLMRNNHVNQHAKKGYTSTIIDKTTSLQTIILAFIIPTYV